MTTTTIFTNLTAPNPPFPAVPTAAVTYTAPAPDAQHWTLTASLTAAGIAAGSPQIFASAQLYGSNGDGNWTPIGPGIAVSGATPQTGTLDTNVQYTQYAAFLTSINPDGYAQATLTLVT